MIRPCPSECCKNQNPLSALVRKYGSYVRKSDRKTIQRFHCLRCKTHFSSATASRAYGQKKRHLNHSIYLLFCHHLTQRDISRLLKIHLVTVARKLKFLGLRSMELNAKYLKTLPEAELQNIQFDDLITFEHSKLKQVSVSLIVSHRSRKILGVRASQIPTSGPNSEFAKRKYGIRINDHPKTLRGLFIDLKGIIPETAHFDSDSHRDYTPIVREVFPRARHEHHKSERAIIAGQGEMKKVQFDPLFSVNHTCAMLRARISRLIRRTWATTKKIEALNWHLQVYAHFHNNQLT